VSVFAFLKCVAIALAGVALHELHILLQKQMNWCNTNSYSDYVDPAVEAPHLCDIDSMQQNPLTIITTEIDWATM
jgi:hypothetical protein